MASIAQGASPLPSLNPYAASDPGFQAQQLDLARRQALAQALTQQGQAPIDYDPHGRISPWQGVSKLAAALTGAYMGNQNVTDAARLTAYGNQMLQQNGFGIGGGSDAPQITNSVPRAAGSNGVASPGSQPAGNAVGGGSTPQALAAALSPQAASQQALAEGAQQGSVGPTVANGASMDSLMAQGQQGAQSPLGSPLGTPAQTAGAASPPLSMPGMSPQQAYMAYVMDPQGYMQALISRSDNRTDLVKTMISAGIDPKSPQGVQFATNYLRKQGYIDPMAVHPGGGFRDPTTGAITMVPAEAPGGYQSVQNPDGSWKVVPTQGGTEAIANSAAATEQGKAPYTLIDTFNTNKNAPSRNYAGNVLPLPAVPGDPVGQPSTGAGGAPTFNIGGSPQQRAGIFSSIANDPTVDSATRQAAAAQLQQMQGGSVPQALADARTNGVQTGPSLGSGQGATNAQNELSANWTAQQQAHAGAQTNIGLLQQLKGLADQSNTGYEPARRQYVTQLGAYLGVPGMDSKASSTDLLGKYSAQLIANLSAKGMSTDAARDIVLAGTPSAKMQPAAIKDAVDGLVAREQMTQARTAAVRPYAMSRDANGYQGAATTFDQVADPRLWQMRGMSPQQLQKFTSNMSPADAAQLVQKYVVAKQSGFLQ